MSAGLQTLNSCLLLQGDLMGSETMLISPNASPALLPVLAEQVEVLLAAHAQAAAQPASAAGMLPAGVTNVAELCSTRSELQPGP